jgi:hypothetical protein
LKKDDLQMSNPSPNVGTKCLDVIYDYCLKTDKRNPYIIANEIMQMPEISMRGPEHHVLIGSALLSAYYNSGGKIDLPEALEKMCQRGGQVPRGVCGNWGNCGSGISAGIFMSIITEHLPNMDNGWRLSNLLTSQCLRDIAEMGGTLCCKRDGLIAINNAVKFVAEHFEINMEIPEKMECFFAHMSNECPKEECPFYVI